MLSVDFYGDTDVVGFHFKVVRVECSPGEYFAPGWSEHNVDLVDGIFPGQIELVEQTLDPSSRHLGSDLFMTLAPGCYDVLAVPASSIDTHDWSPSYDCTAVQAEGVEVSAEQTTDVTLVSQCLGDPIGALDTLVVLNHPPHFDLEIDEKFNFECEPVNVCATIYDRNDDPIEVVWKNATLGRDIHAINAEEPRIIGFDDGHRIWQACAEIVTDQSHEYDLRVEVYDLGWKDGDMVRIEEIVAPEESRAVLTFPIFTSILDENLCFNDEAQLEYVEGVDPTVIYEGCDPTTAEEYYCSGNYNADPKVTAYVCFGSYLREDVYYPVCPGAHPGELSRVKSLKDVDVPSIDHSDFIADESLAIALGKALFWDMGVGQNGQACATCHFSAGSDTRLKNQVSPGLNDLNVAPAFADFDSGSGGPNYTMFTGDFPLHKLSDISDRNSTILSTAGNDVISSMGTFNASISLSDEVETCNSEVDALFALGGNNTRRVEPRNAPTMINAVFNFRNFWDGRANNIFNGVDPLGRRTDTSGILKMVDGGSLVDAHVDLENSSLASQAVGPVLSTFEMTCGATGSIGPDFRRAARRLFQNMPLAGQDVHTSDSALGSYTTGVGLTMSYEDMIEGAFHSKWWDSSDLVDGFTLTENNFSLFFGLAVMAYEATLISDDAPFDQFVEGDYEAMDLEAVMGLGIFLGKGKCGNCHGGAEFTDAATALHKEHEEDGVVERMHMAKTDDITPVALYDSAFYNIGVTPTVEDIGLGAEIPSGTPLSFTRQEKDRAAGGDPPDPFETDPDTFEVDSGVDVDANERDAVDGAFKTSGLRNIELTGPYFHNGGQATLRQVVEFYNRGGDRRSGSSNGFSSGCDNSGLDSNCSNLDPDITSLELSEEEIDQLVAFLKSLTDERVRNASGVFDHPSLAVPVGHDGDEFSSSAANGDECDDEFVYLPAVGSGGRSALGLDPVPSFEDLLDCVDGDPTAVVTCFSDAYEL